MVSHGLEEVITVDAGDFCSWSTVGIFRNGRGEYLVGDDSGCSCYYAFEDWDEGDFTAYPAHSPSSAAQDALRRIDLVFTSESINDRLSARLEVTAAMRVQREEQV